MKRWLFFGLLLIGSAAILLIGSAAVFVGCSSQRQRYRALTWEQVGSRSLEVDSGLLELRTGRQALRWWVGRQEVMILPEGPFRFRPDSGFSGHASLVLLSQTVEGASFESDTTSGSVARRREFFRVDSSSQFAASDQLEVERNAGFRFPFGWWKLGVLTAVLVVTLLWFLWKRVGKIR